MALLPFSTPLYMSFSTFLSNTLLKSNTIFIISRKVCKSSQSGNFIIFLSLRFYVKSNFGIPDVENCHFNTFTGSEVWFFMNFYNFEGWNLTISTKLIATKMAKTAFLELLDARKLISRKIWMIEKSWNFHTVKLQHVENEILDTSTLSYTKSIMEM